MSNNLKITVDNVPILLIGYNRPDYLDKRIIEISKMQIKHLYIAIDGGIESHTKEMIGVLDRAKKLFQNLNTFKITHQENNLGLVLHITESISKVLQDFKYVIIVEDDIEMSKNFYKNMISGFNIQLKFNIYGIIGGFSPTNFSNISFFRNMWRTSPYCAIWGWGCSRDIWSKYQYDINHKGIEDKLNSSKSWNCLNLSQKDLWLNRFVKIQNNPLFTWDIQLQYLAFAENFENLYPVSSIVRNTGFSDLRAAHTKEKKPKWVSKKLPDNRLLLDNSISKLSKYFVQYIDSHTVAGDTRLIKNLLKIRRLLNNKCRKVL